MSVCGGSSSGAPSECSFFSDMLISASQRQEEGETDQEQLDVFSSDSMSDQTETESRAGVSFFFNKVHICASLSRKHEPIAKFSFEMFYNGFRHFILNKT